MCLYPKWIYKRGNLKEDNYRGQKKGDFYELGTYAKCGACPICQNEKSNNWVVRNYYEAKSHEKKCFITLTYKKNPIVIVRKDIQDFMKRLRREITDKQGYKIRMFECMEYGEKNNRPHGHVIIYGWEDKNCEYLDINKKGNIIYKSNIIEKIWGLGRTSYQKFNENEIPYISLYNTPKEEFKRAYKMNMKMIKYMEEYCKKMRDKMDDAQYKNLAELIKETRKELENEKKKYVLIKEFNSWSIALGWEKFKEQYSEKYVFEEYIQDKTFVTPTPWVKKLAKMGSENAIKEMYRREELIKTEPNEAAEKTRNILIQERRKKQDMQKWHDTKKTIETL